MGLDLVLVVGVGVGWRGERTGGEKGRRGKSILNPNLFSGI
jgi:hypothetical protein